MSGLELFPILGIAKFKATIVVQGEGRRYWLMQREGKPSPAYPYAGPATALAGLFLWSGTSVKSAQHADIAAACQKVSWGRHAAGAAVREQMSPCHCA